MAEIPIKGGHVAYVDDDDVKEVANWKWHAVKRPGSRTFYARYNVITPGRKSISIYMHELIIDRPDGLTIDHIDGNGLNNRRSNLRILTHNQNLWNRPHDKGKIVGVKLYGRKWRAHISHEGRKLDCGSYESYEEAVSARDFAAKILRGELAHINTTTPATFNLLIMPDSTWNLLLQVDAERRRTVNV